MTYQGWATQVSLWRETTVLGTKTGNAVRPCGMSEIRLDRNNLVSHSQVGVHGEQVQLEPLHWTHTLTVSRELTFDSFLGMILDAIRTDAASIETDEPAVGYNTVTRNTRLDGATPSFGADLALNDGNVFALRGMTPRRISWSFAATRIITETIEWAVISCLPIAAEDVTGIDLEEEHVPLSGLDATLFFALGADPVAARPGFTGDIIIDREIEPCQHGEDGIATRFRVSTNWRGTGQGLCRLDETAGALYTGQPDSGGLTWIVQHPTDASVALTIKIPKSRFNLRALPVLTSDFLSHALEWMALSETGPLIQTIHVVKT